MTTATTIHAFEQAGLGKAPFTYAGMVDQKISYGQRVVGCVKGVEVTTKPGGTCDYCGTYIVNMFQVTSSDGNTFKVGCECVHKTGDAGLIRKVEADVKRMEKAKRDTRAALKIAADRELCEKAQIGLLADKPHPNQYMAKQGLTLADWAKWMKGNSNWSTLAGVIRREIK